MSRFGETFVKIEGIENRREKFIGALPDKNTLLNYQLNTEYKSE